MLSSKQWNNKTSDIKLVYLYSFTFTLLLNVFGGVIVPVKHRLMGLIIMTSKYITSSASGNSGFCQCTSTVLLMTTVYFDFIVFCLVQVVYSISGLYCTRLHSSVLHLWCCWMICITAYVQILIICVMLLSQFLKKIHIVCWFRVLLFRTALPK